jgi:hypothetical protein
MAVVAVAAAGWVTAAAVEALAEVRPAGILHAGTLSDSLSAS